MKKTVVSVVLIVVFLLSLALSANAACNVGGMNYDLVFSGGTAYCSAQIREGGKSINATMELWQGSSMLASWSDSDTSSVTLSGSVNVSSGMTYTLYVYGTINGVSFNLDPIVKSN